MTQGFDHTHTASAWNQTFAVHKADLGDLGKGSPVAAPANQTTSIDSVRFETDTLGTALHVLETERDALANLSNVYRTDDGARRSLADAINIISQCMKRNGRLVVTGVGKSGKVAEKCIATMNSLSIRSVFLHPVEALHGDIGVIGPADVVLVISFSGRTPELLAMIPHLPPKVSRIVVSGLRNVKECALIPEDNVESWTLLPAPIPISEADSFGVQAPTTSTTVALTLTDALALAVARVVHTDPQVVFRANHPGGAIGKVR